MTGFGGCLDSRHWDLRGQSKPRRSPTSTHETFIHNTSTPALSDFNAIADYLEIEEGGTEHRGSSAGFCAISAMTPDLLRGVVKISRTTASHWRLRNPDAFAPCRCGRNPSEASGQAASAAGILAARGGEDVKGRKTATEKGAQPEEQKPRLVKTKAPQNACGFIPRISFEVPTCATG
jgi:hypothetical protein